MSYEPNPSYGSPDSQNQTPIEKQKKNRKGLLIFAGVMLAIVLIVAASFALMGRDSKGPGKGHDAPYNSGKENVAVIHINGVIQEENQTYNQAWLDRVIQNAYYDDANKAIALVIDSPGGSVYESDQTYLALKKYKEDKGRPVYTYMTHLAASGGYYIAAASDEITANRNTMTGSIGVIGAQAPDISELMNKLGVKMQVVHSGANKLMGSAYSPMTEEQKGIFQALSDEAYAQFTGIVADGRHMDIEKVRSLADGRIYTAKQAKENGLIDEILNSYDEYESFVREKANLDDKVVFKENKYEAPTTLWGSMVKASDVLPNAKQSDLERALTVLEKMSMKEPMYIYMPGLVQADAQ